ncbi:MAG: efflux RND transporter periplasmic adaptor subunit [Bryobacterales bacterium]|nr:efflux RND transporter periplasmic adaptor subunit [Bryobacterales bacterium]
MEEQRMQSNPGSGKLPRSLLLPIAAVAAAAFLAGIFFQKDRTQRATPEAPAAARETHPADIVEAPRTALDNVKFETAQAKLRPVVATIQATGTVGPNETRVAHIRPLANGRIERALVSLGAHVAAGQPLLEYDNIALGELVGQYVVSVAALEKARADSQVAKRALERAQSLVNAGALAQAELDRRAAEFNNSLAAISTRQAEAAIIDEKLHRFGLSDADIDKLEDAGSGYHREASHSVIRAPFAGVVIQYNASPGEVVDSTSDLMTIADLSTVWIQADVYEKDIAQVRVGQQARISVDSFPGETFMGKITYISDFLDPKTRTSRARCEAANPDGRLKLDMFASIQLPTPMTRSAVTVPAEAIQNIGNEPVVFVPAGGDLYRRVKVRLGLQEGDWVEVLSGLKEGETVVAHGSFYLKAILLRDQIGGEE